MKLPGFTAKASLSSSRLHFEFSVDTVIHTDEIVYPAQAFYRWGIDRPTLWPPIECPVGLVPIRVCTKMTKERWVNRGTPWEKYFPATCIEYGWGCGLFLQFP